MRRVVAVVLLAFALSACTDAGRSDANEPCLLRPSEIAAIIHAAVDGGQVSSRVFPEPGLALCTYTTNASFGAVTLAVHRPGQLAFEEAEAAARSNHTISPPFAGIDGLGDRAYSLGNFVSVLQRDAYLTVQAQNPNDAFASVARELARQALLRLS